MNEPRVADDGGRRSTEVEARTVDEAVARGLVRLGGLSRAEVKIEVLSEGRGGLLGFGAELARVRLTELLPGESPEDVPSKPAPEPTEEAGESGEPQPQRPPQQARKEQAGAAERRETPAPPELSGDDEAVAREVVETLIRLLGYEDAKIERRDTLLPVDIDGESSLVLSITGSGTERLLKDDARPLHALQFIARLVIGRQRDSWVNLLVDINGDRARRMQELFQLAEQSATLVEREGHPVSLPPMTAYERRVVHLALRDHPTVVTQSIGGEDTRKVTVRRKDQMLPEL